MGLERPRPGVRLPEPSPESASGASAMPHTWEEAYLLGFRVPL